jgi:SAM-dependent methyltransferase
MLVRRLGRKVITSFRDLAPWVRMRSDWDRRARKDAQYFIACGHSETSEAFWKSGERDLDLLVLHDIDLDASARALEIGCGLGRIVKPLSERVEKVYGVDISAEMIARARRELAGRRNVEVFVTRGRLRNFASASLDFVYSFIVFQHIPAKKAVARYVREAARILKGRGVFRFQVDGRPRPTASRSDTWLGVWYEPEELRRELTRSGFSVADMWGEGTHYLWVTAIRDNLAGVPESHAARVRRRIWQRDSLEALLERMDLGGTGRINEILSGRRFLRQMAERFLEENSRLEPEDFVRRAYQVLLGREADADGLAFYSKEIASGTPPSNTVDCLLSSSELEDRLRPLVAG